MQTATETTGKAKTTPKTPASKKVAAKIHEPATIAEVKLVPVELIDTLPQLRKEFDQEGIKELAKDIEARGLLQPILLNPTGNRYQVIAGERRLRAVILNGSTSIPALLIKASTNDAMMMQLAENIQREDLSLEEECNAIAMLYEFMGSLDKVAEAVKKSKPWCSKRFAMTQKNLNYQARDLLENGVTEDIELLKAFSSLLEYIGWTEGKEWSAKITQGEAGRNEVRAALKAAKEKDKEQKAAAAAKTENISHAKPKTPPPPPPWTIDDAMDDLGQALTYADAELDATDLLNTWTEEQKKQIEDRLSQSAATGAESNGFKIIRKLVFEGLYGTEYWEIDLLAMIAGYSGKPFNWLEFLAQLQTPREKA